MLFQWFAEEGVEVALVEVGLGGRLDATHAWDGGVAAITNVALDHLAWLGDTIPAIAREKAAIIERGDVAVTGATGEALDGDPAPRAPGRRAADRGGAAGRCSAGPGRDRRRPRLARPNARLAPRPAPGRERRRRRRGARRAGERRIATVDAEARRGGTGARHGPGAWSCSASRAARSCSTVPTTQRVPRPSRRPSTTSGRTSTARRQRRQSPVSRSSTARWPTRTSTASSPPSTGAAALRARGSSRPRWPAKGDARRRGSRATGGRPARRRRRRRS